MCLKCKARKETKKRAAGKEQATAARPVRIIRTKQFVLLADYIVKKSVPVPGRTVHTVKRVSAHSAFRIRLEHGYKLDAGSNITYHYFVSVRS
jgi:hypothetical protein